MCNVQFNDSCFEKYSFSCCNFLIVDVFTFASGFNYVIYLPLLKEATGTNVTCIFVILFSIFNHIDTDHSELNCIWNYCSDGSICVKTLGVELRYDLIFD